MSSYKRKKKVSLIRLIQTTFKRLFCHRNIIIISEHKTEHVPISIGFQSLVIMGFLGVIIWFSYSTGNYMAAQSVLKEKERKIASTNLENRRIESEFALLKRDLIKMIDDNGESLSDYSKFVIEQYKNEEPEEGASNIDLSKVSTLNHGVVLERIAFLEQKVEAMKQDHVRLIDSIKDATKGKIKEFEKIIGQTGLSAKKLEKAALREEKIFASKPNNDPDAPKGGPFDPVSRDILMEHDASLYNDLKRMMVLDDIIENLPLARPMRNARKTSGYGMRVDPFRKRLARHAGIDFAGPLRSPIYATSDGVVRKAGRRGAYGLAVQINHAYNISTLYGHMSRIKVKPGQRVKKGDIIGLQGNTGRSTGAHLHYEVRYFGKTVDPDDFLKAGKNVR